jgi:hypothetical protein
MPTTEQMNIEFTGTSAVGGQTVTLNATLTYDVATQTSGGFTGHLITAISGTLVEGTSTESISSLMLTGASGYENNDNLFSPTGQHFDSDGVSFIANGDQINLYDNGTPPSVSYALTDSAGTAIVDTGSLVIKPVCFVTGTRIKTTRGEVGVEDLAVGDVALTASGEARPITWIGSRAIQRPVRAHWPIRVAASAFGEGLPARDLLLSPGHAVRVKVMDEVFVPIGELVNGATIAREEVAEVTYWHVELESHDVLLAEGLGCESYMDAGNRAWFTGGEGAPDPERAAASLAAYARPFVDRGPVIEALRQRLTAHAETLGWTRSPNIDLHLLVDGNRVEPAVDGDLARFLFPAGAQSAVLVSNTFSPAWTGQSQDQRELGVMVRTLAISDGLRVDRRITPDHPALGEGFHKLEHKDDEPRRWTDGRAPLPASLWDGCKGQVILTLTFKPGGWTWTAPRRARKGKVVPMRVA